MDGFIVSLFPDGLVGTNAEHFKWGCGGKRPFAQKLRQQAQRRHQYQRALRSKVFLDPQGDVGLAGAASHDELAPVGALQTLGSRSDGLNLVFPWLGCCAAFALRECGKVGWVIKLGLLEVGQQKTDNGLFLGVADLSGIAADQIRGGDQQAVGYAFAIGLAEEFIDIVFGDVVVGRVALGLHGPVLAVLVAKYQVNPTVRTPAFRPVIPQPDLVDLRGPLGVSLQKPFDEVLELLAPFCGVGIEALVEIRK